MVFEFKLSPTLTRSYELRNDLDILEHLGWFFGNYTTVADGPATWLLDQRFECQGDCSICLIPVHGLAITRGWCFRYLVLNAWQADPPACVLAVCVQTLNPKPKHSHNQHVHIQAPQQIAMYSSHLTIPCYDRHFDPPFPCGYEASLLYLAIFVLTWGSCCHCFGFSSLEHLISMRLLRQLSPLT